MRFNRITRYLFRIRDPEQSETLQRLLSIRNITWGIGGDIVRNTGMAGLVVRHNRLTYIDHINSQSSRRHIRELNMREIDTARFIEHEILRENLNLN